jgi:hypothetical protein
MSHDCMRSNCASGGCRSSGKRPRSRDRGGSRSPCAGVAALLRAHAGHAAAAAAVEAAVVAAESLHLPNAPVAFYHMAAASLEASASAAAAAAAAFLFASNRRISAAHKWKRK